MASRNWKIRAFCLILAVFLLVACGRAQGGEGLNRDQEFIRVDIGFKKDGDFSSREEGRLRDAISRLIQRGSTSALFDRALLYFRDNDALKMFRGFKEYYDATGDATRIFLYVAHGNYIDELSWIRHKYYLNLVEAEKKFAQFELNEFDPRLSSIPMVQDDLVPFDSSKWKNYSTLQSFVEGTLAQERPDVESVERFYRLLDEKATVKNLVDTLMFLMRFEEAYQVFDYHRRFYDQASREDRALVPPFLYFSGHYQEFLDWYHYDHPSFSEFDMMTVGSLAKLGRFDESVRVLSDLVSHATLKIWALRQPSEIGDEPVFFNLLFFYYFGGVYDDFERAGKIEEIDRLFEKRYYSYTQNERDQHLFSTYPIK